MEISALLKAFCAAVERRDGKGFASLFTEDGVYHDVFYGDFKGREKIAEMIDDWFYRTAHEFRIAQSGFLGHRLEGCKLLVGQIKTRHRLRQGIAAGILAGADGIAER